MIKVHIGESQIHGTGVFASQAIRPGEVILRMDDSRVISDKAELNPAKGEYDHHCDYLANGKVVYMQEPERYINHCCEPNTAVEWIGGERYVVARKQIVENAEITYDYCIDSYGDTVWECYCGDPSCRKTISADYYQLPLEKQIEYSIYLSDWFIEETREQFDALRRKMSLDGRR